MTIISQITQTSYSIMGAFLGGEVYSVGFAFQLTGGQPEIEVVFVDANGVESVIASGWSYIPRDEEIAFDNGFTQTTETLIIRRATIAENQVALTAGESFDIGAIEKGLDRGAMSAQDLRAKLQRIEDDGIQAEDISHLGLLTGVAISGDLLAGDGTSGNPLMESSGETQRKLVRDNRISAAESDVGRLTDRVRTCRIV